MYVKKKYVKKCKKKKKNDSKIWVEIIASNIMKTLSCTSTLIWMLLKMALSPSLDLYTKYCPNNVWVLSF